MTTLMIRVYGTPAPQGSKNAFPIHRKDGSTGVALVESAGQKLTTWRQAVRLAAMEAMRTRGWKPGPDPASVSLEFFLPRPKSHYGTGRNAGTLKPSAPKYPTTRPDLDKLTRATNDALTQAGAIFDDSKIIDQPLTKGYADDIDPGAFIIIERLT